MKTIGLIGGMSFESSIEYERKISNEIAARLGDGHTAKMVTITVDFHELHVRQDANEWAELDDEMVDIALRLQNAGADMVLICSNTMHRCAPAIEATIGVPLLHLADATAAAIRAEGVERVALLGTRTTMTEDFYLGRLRDSHGLDVIVPDESERDFVHEVIMSELTRGVQTDKSRDGFLKIIRRLRSEGAAGVIAGCTEIEQLVFAEHLDCPYFPTAEIHALAAVDAALG